MSITRKVFVTIFGIIALPCLCVAVSYLVLQQTVLNSATAKQWVQSDQYRNSMSGAVLAPKIIEAINQRIPEQKLLDKAMVERALDKALPADFYSQASTTIVDATYKWLNAEAPTVSFSVPIKSHMDAFFAAIKPEINQKIAALETCSSFAVDEAEVISGVCRPLFISVEQATDQTISSLQSAVPYQENFTENDLPVRLDQETSPPTVSDIVSYLWLANLVALGFAALFTLIILVSGRWFGFVVMGIVTLLTGVFSIVASRQLPDFVKTIIGDIGNNATFSLLIQEMSNSIRASGLRYGLIMIAIGVVLAVIGIFWRSRKKPDNTPRFTSKSAVIDPIKKPSLTVEVTSDDDSPKNQPSSNTDKP